MMDYVSAPTFRQGARQLLQLCGVGPLRPNTLLLGFPEDTNSLVSGIADSATHVDTMQERAVQCYYTLRDALRLHMSVALVRLHGHDINFYAPEPFPHRRHGCDVWWVMDDGGFSLLLPHLLMLSPYWKTVTAKCQTPSQRTRYCAVNNSRLSALHDARTRHERLLTSFRLHWPIEIVPMERRVGSDGNMVFELDEVCFELCAVVPHVGRRQLSPTCTVP